jgi:hypothetical protein
MDVVRKVLAILFVVRSLTNFGKPFDPQSGFVVLGRLMHGAPWTTIVAPLFSVAMIVYAWTLWTARPAARPLSILYAIWATINVVRFPMVEGVPPRFQPWMYGIFAVPGIVVPWLAVWLAWRAPDAR